MLKPAVTIEAALTGLLCVDHEAGIGESGSLDEAVAMNFDAAGVANLRLDDHDGDGTVGDMSAVLQDADAVFAHLTGDERDPCEAKQTGLDLKTGLYSLCKCVFALLPMWLLAILFSRQGSSRPDGARMLAVSRLRSVSLMSREKSAAEPSLT